MEAKTILVIEDNKLNIKLVKAVLHLNNHRVLVAEDAETGLRVARKKQPDLILMDIQLPAMDGLEATQIIKADPETSHIPVIAMTSHAMKKDREKAIDAGCDDYISKPIEQNEFLDKIVIYLDSETV